MLVEHAQHRRAALGGHRAGIPVQRGDAGGHGGVEGVGLAPSAGQLAHPGGRGGRDIQNGLAAGEQPLREVVAQARWWPRPSAFSTAHCRSSNRFAQASSLRYSVRLASIRSRSVS